MKDTYLTIEQVSEGIYKEKGSKFIAYAYPVKSESDVKDYVDDLKKKYYDARHHCFAYVIGNEGEHFRTNDDGEPNHSAGDPILGQIRSRGLTNVLVVVVRYFGGTKLGVPGLINAYKEATSEALDNNKIVENLITEKVNLQFNYPDMNNVMRIIKEFDLEIAGQEMGMNCEMTLKVRLKNMDAVCEKFSLLQGVSLV